MPNTLGTRQKKFRKRALQLVNALKQRMLKLGFTLDGFDRDKMLAILSSGIGQPCRYCGQIIKTATMSPDHPTPVSRGGEPWVIQVCCQRCNRRKGTMLEAEYQRLMEHVRTYCPETQAYILRMLSAGAAFPMMQRGMMSLKRGLTAAKAGLPSA